MSRASVNKTILIGTLGKDPEVRFAANGTAIANLSVATSETWNDRATGEKQEKTEWHKVVIFGKLAEIAQQYLTKGSQVYLEGKLQTRKWQDQTSGQDRYITEVVLQPMGGVMQMLGGGQQGGGQHNDYNQDSQQGGQAPLPQQGGYQQAPMQNQQAPQQGGYQQAPMQGGMGYQGGSEIDDVPF